MMKDIKIAVIGLGYVGLPLARLFATKYAVVGFDVKKERVEELRRGEDSTLEVLPEVLKGVLRQSVPGKTERGLYFTCDVADMKEDFYLYCIENSDIQTGVMPQRGDQILTLSTCANLGSSVRWVVHAIRRY